MYINISEKLNYKVIKNYFVVEIYEIIRII